MHSRVSIMELQKIIDAYVAINNNSSKPFYRLYLARAVCRLIHKKKNDMQCMCDLEAFCANSVCAFSFQCD